MKGNGGRRKRGLKSGGKEREKEEPILSELTIVLTSAICKLKSSLHMLSAQVLLPPQ